MQEKIERQILNKGHNRDTSLKHKIFFNVPMKRMASLANPDLGPNVNQNELTSIVSDVNIYREHCCMPITHKESRPKINILHSGLSNKTISL